MDSLTYEPHRKMFVAFPISIHSITTLWFEDSLVTIIKIKLSRETTARYC